MKRDLDLIRKIVLAVEELPTGMALDKIEIDGYSSEQIGYHSYLVVDSGLAEGLDVQTLDDTSPNWRILHLTSEGHDFADAARSETTWKKARSIVAEKGGGATLEVVKQVSLASSSTPLACKHLAPNPSIERTCKGKAALHLFAILSFRAAFPLQAAHVKR